MKASLFDLSGQVALVTGAAQGIGFGIALELARAGSRVVIADRDLPKAKAAAEAVGKAGADVIALPLDVTDAKSVDACVRASLQHFPRIDVLVNNAGIHCETIGEISTVEQFNRCLDVNLIGAWRMAQALAPHFQAQGCGRIVNIASIDGRKAWADTPAYSASKAALINLTQSLALKFGAHNTTVNAICPGGVMTAMADSFMQRRPALEEEIIRARPLNRALQPEDMGRVVVFLASAESKHITGQCLNVDGGAVMS